MTSQATQQQVLAFQQVFDALFEFLEWAFGATAGGADRADFEHQVLSSWAHPDGTVQQFFSYVGGLHTTVFSQPERSRERYRGEVQRLFARMFSAPDPSERGQILARLYRLLERACPDCTGVARPGATAAAASAVPRVPATAPPPPLAQSSAMPGPQSGQMWPSPAQPTTPPPAPVGPAYHQTATQGYPWQHQSVPQPGAAPGVGHAGGSPGPQPTAASVPQLQQMVMDEQIRQQRLMMDQKIWDMRHNNAMEIIRSMR